MTRSPVAVIAVVFSILSGPGWAASKAELDLLRKAMSIERLLEIMREEGLSQSEDLREDMFPGRGGTAWRMAISGIYDVPEMQTRFSEAFDKELADTDVTLLIDFFTSARGREIVRLELEGRSALLEPGVEDAAYEAFSRMEAEGGPRVTLLRDFVEVNDLVEYNVMGAMNANLFFMRGLSDGDGFEMSEADILADIWSREAEIRTDTSDWLFAYLAMAYQPLGFEDLRAYYEFSASPAGQDLNRALFAGFDTMFNEMSFALGRAVSRFMIGEDL
ncbi:hypothetical protein [Silicimonas sp. MF1-12-2]|uniref:hypothetical protein n=1 Tax=Silicimonas sp. MF1-12-2 TaxID=3384793 RepID=UPI0039B52391